MPILHIGSTTVESATTAALVNNVPTGTFNGCVLTWRVSDTTTTIPATPSGWTLLQSGSSVATQMTIWYRVASSEPASYTTGAMATGRHVGIMSAWSGVDNVTPWDVATPAFGAGTTAISPPAITPVTAGAWVLGFADGNVGSGITTTTISTSNLTAIDSQVTSTNGAATNNVGAVGHFLWASGAFTPAFTASQTLVRTLGGSAALRPYNRGVITIRNRAAILRASTI